MKQKLEYININSPIHKANPTIKILYLILFTIISYLPNNLDYIVLANCILALYLIISSRIPLKYYLQNILKTKLIIIAMFIILASLRFTLLKSLLIVLPFILAVCLFSMLIYTSHPFDLAMGIYDIVKYINILGINKNSLFIKIYNFVYFKKDYEIEEEKIIEGREIKGENIRGRNILARASIHVNLMPEVMKKVRTFAKKRTDIIIKNNFKVENYVAHIRITDIIYLLMFGLLIFMYILKVV